MPKAIVQLWAPAEGEAVWAGLGSRSLLVYTDNPEGEWQVKVFAADSPDGNFQPVESNPVMRGQRACLFQHVFGNRFYGFNCHLQDLNHWALEQVETRLPQRSVHHGPSQPQITLADLLEIRRGREALASRMRQL